MRSLSLLLLVFASTFTLSGQEIKDDRATLVWVQRQADSINQVLAPAVKLSEKYEFFTRLLRAHELFAAVSLVAPYCNAARTAAVEGMSQTAWLNNQLLSTDQGALIMRATRAMSQAHRMRSAAANCLEELGPQAKQACLVENTIQSDAKIAIMYLEDGLAVKDFHILSQKVEYAMILISQMQTIAQNCTLCDEVKNLLNATNTQAKEILIAANWIEINQIAQATILNLKQISESSCTP
jgi:hypothetical protein